MKIPRCAGRGLTLALCLAPFASAGEPLPKKGAQDKMPSAAVDPWQPLAWPEITRECRPWAYHWWLGSAVDKENLSRELRRYSEAGMGGVHVVCIYGAKGAESRYLSHLSPPWVEMFDFAVKEAASLDMGVDLTTGTGWNFGGKHITSELGGQKTVAKRISFPADGKPPKELMPPKVTLLVVAARGPDGARQDLFDKLGTDGVLAWKPPTDGWSIDVFGCASTEWHVKRPAPGGDGLMINPFYPAAMRKHLARFSDIFDAPGVARPRAMYHDSYEYYGAKWSPDFLAEFEKRRGYRLQDELDMFVSDGNSERVCRARTDYLETLSELQLETFAQWTKWCHDRGMITRNQAHGTPCNLLDFYAVADIPETEMFRGGEPDRLVSRFCRDIATGNGRDVLFAKFASSAAHTAGRRLTAAETGTWMAEHFCGTWEELKALSDLMLVSGINHIFWHGTVYSPDDAAWPGWLFYASTQINPRNPLWREVRALHGYVARAQAVLQLGLPDNDVLLYWPVHETWASQSVRRELSLFSAHEGRLKSSPVCMTAGRLWKRGYGLDYVSDNLLAGMRVEDGLLRGPDGAAWRAVLVPPAKLIPETTMARLVAFAEAGATIVFQDRLPEDVPGLGRLEERRVAFAEQMKRLGLAAAPKAVKEARVGRGLAIVGPLEEALTAAGIRREPITDSEKVQFLRRRFDGGRHYFIVNHGLAALDGWYGLATPAASAAILDPLSGATGIAALRSEKDGGVEVRLQLEPGHSLIVRTFETERVAGPAWPYERSREEALKLAGPWKVDFVAGGPVLPKPYEVAELRSWTEGDDPDRVRFGGTAAYTTTFDAPVGAGPWMLDLGEVKHLARVRLNGSDLGALIMHPYRLRLDTLKPTGNTLVVEVTNLAANRIRDMDQRKVEWRIFRDINFVTTKYQPFDASKWPVFESGLLGPVRILKVRMEN